MRVGGQFSSGPLCSTDNVLWKKLMPLTMFRRSVRTPPSHSCETTLVCPVLVESKRRVVQSNKLPSPGLLESFEKVKRERLLNANKGGNYYRHQRKLWSSIEALECDLTKEMYTPIERTPLHLLLATTRPPAAKRTLLQTDGDEVIGQRPIEEKILSDLDVVGSALESAASQSSSSQYCFLESHETYSDPTRSGTVWGSLPCLDPQVQAAAARVLGPTATRLQSRLLPLLLNPDHNDVIFNAEVNSGKTCALALAVLQAARSESAGLNVIVSKSEVEGKRLMDKLAALCGAAGDAFVDRSDSSWLMHAPIREDVASYVRRLRRSAAEAGGGVRVLLSTPDVMCELLFEHKLEFEQLGYLRRVLVDDTAEQIKMLLPTDSPQLVKARLRDPVALELLLGTLHQLPSPHVRSILQIGCVGADIDTQAKEYLQALCLKPQAHKAVMSLVPLPTSVHIVFTFHQLIQRSGDAYASGLNLSAAASGVDVRLSSAQMSTYQHMLRLMRNARAAIPGRAVVVVPNDVYILDVRKYLRQVGGMDVKLLSEVYDRQGQRSPAHLPWKFCLASEAEAVDVAAATTRSSGQLLSHVSHVVLTFPPSDHKLLLHLSRLTTVSGNLGWMIVVTGLEYAKHCRKMCENLEVDFMESVVDDVLQKVPAEKLLAVTKDPSLYPMDPQYIVAAHQDSIAENPDLSMHKHEFFAKPHHKHFYREDHTPLAELWTRWKNAKALESDFEKDPVGTAQRLQSQGFVDRSFRPTEKLWRATKAK